MNDHNDQDLLGFAKQHLEESAENLTPDTASRLRAARYEALHHRARKVYPGLWPAWGFRYNLSHGFVPDLVVERLNERTHRFPLSKTLIFWLV